MFGIIFISHSYFKSGCFFIEFIKKPLSTLSYSIKLHKNSDISLTTIDKPQLLKYNYTKNTHNYTKPLQKGYNDV